MVKLLENAQCQVIGQAVVEASKCQWGELLEVYLYRQVQDGVTWEQTQQNRVSGMVGLARGYD